MSGTTETNIQYIYRKELFLLGLCHNCAVVLHLIKCCRRRHGWFIFSCIFTRDHTKAAEIEGGKAYESCEGVIKIKELKI